MRSSLKEGQQKFYILSVVSPVELYLCTSEQFEEFTQVTFKRFNQVAAKGADFIYKVIVGDFVLASINKNWFRAKVIRELPMNSVELELVDTLEVFHVNKIMLRKVPLHLMEIPTPYTMCQLDSFFGREMEAREYVDKARDLMRSHCHVHGEVLHYENGIARVTIPSVESKLR